MTQFLLDISHWQGTAPDLAQAKKEGIVGVIAKATQGSGYVDDKFAFNMQRSRSLGLLFAAYHYQTAGDTAAAQVEHIKRVVPKDVPVIPDVEHGSGHVSKTRTIVKLLREAGYTVPLSYIPGWYWSQIGSPSLAGLPPLWSSRYPDNVQSYYKDEYRQIENSFTHFWDGYGGLEVKLLQFTSSARVAGYGPLDCNAFRGTYAELEALFTGNKDKEDELTKEEHAMLTEVWNRLREFPTLADVRTDVLKAVDAVPAKSATELLNRDVVPNLGGGDPENKNVKVKWALGLALGAARDAAKPGAPVDVAKLAAQLKVELGAALASELSKRLAA